MSEKPPVDPLENTHADSIRPGKLLAGAPIGGYELQHVLGEGGMGVVWCARDPLLDRTIAIKVLKSRDVAASMRTRLLREAQAMAQIKHPNVLTVHRVGTEGERDFIVMELVDGGPLDHWLAFGPPETEVLDALLAAGRGLAAAHAAGLVHRDFKPNNVLRSKDGRVMVTDFGLARGLGEDWTSPVGPTGSLDPDATTSSSGRAKDNVLDSPLTKTGALIGTPAYMAPEQFEGSEPDPRTDQYAFCVTAWQALTGARPHHGRTLDELRQAANLGVGGVVTNLSKQMRGVLARGLDPDPKNRWPDLETLLREIERAGRPRKSKLPWVAGGVTAAIALAVIAYVATRGAAGPVCEPVDTAWADAWSPSKLALADTHPHLHGILDDHKKRWFAVYDQTCKVPAGPRPLGRLSCLSAVRSRIATVGAVLGKDPSTRGAIDPWLYLASPEACAGRPADLIAFPEDDRVTSVIAKSIVVPSDPGLDGAAQASGFPMLAPLVTLTRGLHHLREHRITEARADFDRAATAAETLDARLFARARLGLLAASMAELARPDAKSKAEALHDEIETRLTYAKSAVKLAGDDPVLVGILALLEAEALADLAERTKKPSFVEAIERAETARARFETVGDPTRAALAAARYAEIQLRRGDPTVLGKAERVASNAADALERAKLPPVPALDRVLGRVLFARNDIAGAHTSFDRAAPPPGAIAGNLIEGVVIDNDGLPVMNAVVVAWVGELHGDPTRLYTDRSTVDGEIVEAGAEGKFKVHKRTGTVVVAETPGGSARSVPIAIGNDPVITLRLTRTGEISGTVEALAPANVDAYARLMVGETAWFVHAPNANGFRIGGLPAGAWQLGTIGAAGTTTRRFASDSATLVLSVVGRTTSTARMTSGNHRLLWPGGRMIDVVVRGTKIDDGATAWLVAAADAARFKNRDDFEVLFANARDATSSPLFPLGSRTTDAGRQYYLAGMRHALLVGDFTNIAACVAPNASGDAAVICKKVEPEARAVAIDLP